MKIFRLILLILGLFIVLLFAIPLFISPTAQVERSVVINRPIDEVFAVAADFNNYEKWSPWREMEDDAIFEVVYNDSIVGSKIQWEGDTIGKGYLIRTHAHEYSLIESDLVFLHPIESQVKDFMRFETVKNGTRVTWANEMILNYPFGRYMTFIIESFLGNDFDKGLSKLKVMCDSIIETPMYEITEEQHHQEYIYFVSDSSDLTSAGITRVLNRSYNELSRFYQRNKLDNPEHPIAITRKHTANRWHFDVAYIAADTLLKTNGRIQKGVLSADKVLKCVYIGPYQDGYLAYRQIHNYMKLMNYEPDGLAWEVYISEAQNANEEQLITHIYYPFRAAAKKE